MNVYKKTVRWQDGLFFVKIKWRARRESNPRTWLRRPVLYPLSYERTS